MNYGKKIWSALAVVTILAAPLSTEAAKFNDIPANASYEKAVEKLVKFNVLGGYADQTFKPNQPVTRAQAASIMAKALALDLQQVKAPGFTDVQATNGHYAAIAKLTELGIFTKAEKFNPNSPITRVQMAKMLVQAFELQSTTLQNFNDVKPSDWYYEHVGILGALKVTKNKGKFDPNGIVTRAHFATFVERVITMKRGDGLSDMWDRWGAWDSRGVIGVPTIPIIEKPVQKPIEKPQEQPKEPVEVVKESNPELVKKIDTVIDDLQSSQDDVEDVLEDLEEAIDDNDKKDIEKEKKKLSNELQELDRLLARAKDLLEQAEDKNSADVAKITSVLETEIRKATKTYTKAFAETFDKDYYDERFEDLLDDLEKEIKAANKAIKDTSFNRMEETHEDLIVLVAEAQKARESYKDSNVSTLKDLDADVAKAVKEATNLIDDIEEWFEDRLDSQLDNFKDSFDDALDELDDALDDGKKSKIYDAKEKIEKLISNAQKVVDDYEDIDFDSLQKDLTSFEDLIAKAKKELRDAK